MSRVHFKAPQHGQRETLCGWRWAERITSDPAAVTCRMCCAALSTRSVPENNPGLPFDWTRMHHGSVVTIEGTLGPNAIADLLFYLDRNHGHCTNLGVLTLLGFKRFRFEIDYSQFEPT